MKSLLRSEINPIKMVTNPPKEVVNADMKVINSDGFIYKYVGIGWVKDVEATRTDYLNIPQLL